MAWVTGTSTVWLEVMLLTGLMLKGCHLAQAAECQHEPAHDSHTVFWVTAPCICVVGNLAVHALQAETYATPWLF